MTFPEVPMSFLVPDVLLGACYDGAILSPSKSYHHLVQISFHPWIGSHLLHYSFYSFLPSHVPWCIPRFDPECGLQHLRSRLTLHKFVLVG